MRQKRLAKMSATTQGHQRKHGKVMLIASVALIGALAAGGTLAYLFTDTKPVPNVFEPAEVTCAVVEPEYTTDEKTDVRVRNTGDVNAYIRAEIIVNWADENGNVFGKPVEEGDYTIELGSGWVEGSDGFWYWTQLVEPGKETGYLISLLKQNVGVIAPAGYYLSVSVLSSAIQADGIDESDDSAVVGAWYTEANNLKTANGALSVTPKA